jgi:hypothetical protein
MIDPLYKILNGNSCGFLTSDINSMISTKERIVQYSFWIPLVINWLHSWSQYQAICSGRHVPSMQDLIIESVVRLMEGPRS